MRFNSAARRACLVPALGLVLVTATAACSSSSSTSASAPATVPASPAPATASAVASSGAAASSSAGASGGPAAAVSEIKTNWNTFFSSATPNSRRVQLLQNGSQFAASIQAFAASPLAAAVTSKVDSVTLSSAAQAKVKYDLSALGQKVASGASGTAVRQDGTWKVGDDVFCGLLKEGSSVLNIKVPAACGTAR
ncbi:MAG TPA: hypothetical protein VGD91_15500 [Trebonia sp.]